MSLCWILCCEFATNKDNYCQTKKSTILYKIWMYLGRKIWIAFILFFLSLTQLLRPKKNIKYERRKAQKMKRKKVLFPSPDSANLRLLKFEFARPENTNQQKKDFSFTIISVVKLKDSAGGRNCHDGENNQWKNKAAKALCFSFGFR